MKSFRSMCKLAVVIILAALLCLVETVDGANTFRRCYNTTVETHCFDAQYDANNGLLTASFENARRRCTDLNSTLLIIKNEEINQIVLQYWNERNNPITGKYVWTDAYRVNDFNNTYTWHWIDSTLPTIKASDVPYTYDYKYYVAVLEITDNTYMYGLAAKAPNQEFNYICEYPASKCPTSSSNNVREFNGRCYDAIRGNAYWYDARNRCIKDGGDLASFVNISSINFTSWLNPVPYAAYFIGLQFTWYIWIDTGEAVGYSNWKSNVVDQNQYYLVALYDYPSSSLSWYRRDSTTDVNIVCHSVTLINPPTTSTTPTTTSTTITTTSISTSSTGSQTTRNESSEGRASNKLAIGVGVGVGVGVPILIALIVLIICIVIRKRRHKTPSSKQSSNHQHKETSVDQPSETPTDNGRSEAGGPTYGTVVPSTIARQAAETDGAIPTSGNAEYASLQFL